ncbi:CPBP family intramembrane glutamic endopeptidase [Thermococcus sp. Bubb.Bath]|uniref:CPBP family intramembrane glutamic endopeptidase n=1 Tax=Thermococcus sp. Bubb.Bath TaxID=1638242 RepID=UPI00143BB1C7|nr:type II CAAX endopeptidase family protein [Thermococcus sp. Bubb.Bath]NJF25020.1 CPBP family intramembrane metalloprotease [Thermococcus sp. Bubb.Bath]
MGGAMNPLIVFTLAFFLFITKALYTKPLVKVFQRKFGEIAGYWLFTSFFTVLLAVFVTLLCPGVYFVRWDFPVRDFLIFFSLALLSSIPAIPEFRDFFHPKSKEERKELELVKSLTFAQAAAIQVISAALPEELVNRYIFLGLISLWNPLVGLVGISIFFGLAHKFSHSNRRWGMLLFNTLVGLVLGWAYLYTGSLLLVMTIHWLGNMLPWAYLRYASARKAILGTTILFAVLPPVILRNELTKAIDYLSGIYSTSGLLWGALIGLSMLGVAYAVLLMLKRGKKA